MAKIVARLRRATDYHQRVKLGRRGWTAIYASWIATCAVLVILLAGAQDPSRRRDRVPQRLAGKRALHALREIDPVAYRGYQIVHIAWARAGELGAEPRWLVLCDTVPRSGLRDAVVVEIDGRTARFLTVRRAR